MALIFPERGSIGSGDDFFLKGRMVLSKTSPSKVTSRSFRAFRVTWLIWIERVILKTHLEKPTFQGLELSIFIQSIFNPNRVPSEIFRLFLPEIQHAIVKEHGDNNGMIFLRYLCGRVQRLQLPATHSD